MRFALIFAALCLWVKCAMAVIQDGVITFDPVPGATRYTLWKVLPGQTVFQYVASFTTNRYVMQGPIAQGTSFYLRSITPSAGGQYYVESDFGFVVTPPEGSGTNILRFVGLSTPFKLQSATSADGPYVDIGIYSNTPLQLQLKRAEFMRTVRTNLPPPAPGVTP